jgi:hypothetical protein
MAEFPRLPQRDFKQISTPAMSAPLSSTAEEPSLCDRCRTIDFLQVFRTPPNPRFNYSVEICDLGRRERWDVANCNVCQMFSDMVDSLQSDDQNERFCLFSTRCRVSQDTVLDDSDYPQSIVLFISPRYKGECPSSSNPVRASTMRTKCVRKGL